MNLGLYRATMITRFSLGRVTYHIHVFCFAVFIVLFSVYLWHVSFGIESGLFFFSLTCIWNIHIMQLKYTYSVMWTDMLMPYNIREKGRDLTQSSDKSAYTHRKLQKAKWQHKNATKTFDYTTIADRLRMASWSNDSHPIGVVKAVYGIHTFH